MLFVAVCTDKPGAYDKRMAARPAHLEWIAAQGSRLRLGGPMLGPDGKPVGSIFLWEGDSREAVEALAAQDPYMQAGIFESVVLRPFRVVMQDGKQVAP